jgi:hypothetical protein
VDAGGWPLYFARTFNWVCIRWPSRDRVLDELRDPDCSVSRRILV